MTQEFSVKGAWKTPDMNQWFYGELSFDPETGGKLQLVNNETFAILKPGENRIIIGKSYDEKLYTLIDFSRIGSKGSAVNYSISVILKGVHISSREELKFTTVKFSLLNAKKWFGKTGINVDRIEGGFDYSFRYPEKVTFDSEGHDGEVNFGLHSLGPNIDRRISISEYVLFVLNYHSPKDLREVFSDVFIYTGFITLMTFQQSYPESIVLEKIVSDDSSKERNKFIKVFYKHTLYRKGLQENWYKGNLVNFDDEKFDFTCTISKWYKLYKNNIYLINCALSYFRDVSFFSEDIFMNVMRCLEGFHRDIVNTKKKKPTFKDRIREMVERLSEGDEALTSPDFLLFEEIKGQGALDEFIKIVINTRNYHAHLDYKGERKIYKGIDLYYECNVLVSILLSNILMEIGVDRTVFMNQWTEILSYKAPNKGFWL